MQHSINPDSSKGSYILSLPIFELMLLVGVLVGLAQSYSLYLSYGAGRSKVIVALSAIGAAIGFMLSSLSAIYFLSGSML